MAKNGPKSAGTSYLSVNYAFLYSVHYLILTLNYGLKKRVNHYRGGGGKGGFRLIFCQNRPQKKPFPIPPQVCDRQEIFLALTSAGGADAASTAGLETGDTSRYRHHALMELNSAQRKSFFISFVYQSEGGQDARLGRRAGGGLLPRRIRGAARVEHSKAHG
jgi:hypothetical protein